MAPAKKPTPKTQKSTGKKPAKKPVKKSTRKQTKPEEIIKPLTPAEQICSSVEPKLKSQAVTLANAVLTMQEKIEQQIPIYKRMPLAQQVTVGTGESMLRTNPATQEFRATVRDYASALNCLEDILDGKKAVPEKSTVDDIRKRFGIG